jgi:SAM-dependent methyltransferase
MVAPDPLFSQAQAYERFMGRWSRILAPRLVRFAGVRDGDAVLDVGAGTGALAAAIARAAPASRIVGIDPTAAYVELARSNLAGSLIQFEVGDAQDLRFAGATFERSLSLLVLNFVRDAAAAVREMKRVTRAGGTIAAAVWDYGEGMQMLRAFWDEAGALRPEAAARDERNMPLCRRGELGALWREQGLEDVVETELIIDTRFTSFDDFWQPFLGKQGPAGAYVAALTHTEQSTLAERLRERLLRRESDGPVALQARAWAVRGTLPR